MAVGWQMSFLAGANQALQSKLKEAEEEVSRAKLRVGPLVRAAQEAEEGKKATLFELG